MSEVYLEPCQITKKELFTEINNLKNAPYKMFDRVLSTPLYV